MSLKITSEDKWLSKYIDLYGDCVLTSPQYLSLKRFFIPLKYWCSFRNLDFRKKRDEIEAIMCSIKEQGQLTPIKIYSDMRINNGHKRASAMLYLGFKTIKAEIVDDNYKL